ncbi:MAG TPA: hypothetical protein DCX65_13705 [Spirochaetaceae bacterium]|nr:hypothetical protein [Spirochaetaceae bacterium]
MACGLLVETARAVETWLGANPTIPPPADPPPPLSALSWMTRDRPEAIARALTAWQACVLAAGLPPPDCVISDDSVTDPAATRRVALGFASQYPGRSYYLSRAWRQDFAAALGADSAEPAAAAFAFGLSGMLPAGTYGANANCLLLALGGRLFAMSDDDILPEFRHRVDARDGLAFQSAPDPSVIQPLADQAELAGCGVAATRPAFHAHQAYLGRPLRELLTSAGRLDLTGLRPHSLTRAAAAEARVVALCFHYWGDSGMNQARYLISGRRQLDDPEFDEARYLVLRRSKLVFRAPRTDTIGGNAMLNGHLCLDARHRLPPFSPSGRNLDGLWGYCLATLQPDHFMLYPLEAIHHAPLEARQATDPRDYGWHPEMNSLLSWALQDYLGNYAPLSDPYASLGTFLRDLGGRPQPELRAYLLELASRLLFSTLDKLAGERRTWRGLPRAWAADIEANIDSLEAALTAPTLGLPAELKADPAAVGPYFRAFGGLLTAWPQLVASAAQLAPDWLERTLVKK